MHCAEQYFEITEVARDGNVSWNFLNLSDGHVGKSCYGQFLVVGKTIVGCCPFDTIPIESVCLGALRW